MNSNKSLSLSVIMPVFNEASSLEMVIQDHIKVISTLSEIDDWEIICLDDASTDQSLAILQRLSSTIPQLKILTNKRNKGINALFAKLQTVAQGDLIYQTAADGQWPAENLRILFDLFRKNSIEVAFGVHENRRSVYGIWRNLPSVTFNNIPRLLYGSDLRDINGIKLAKKKYFQIPVVSTSFFCEIERFIEAERRNFTIGFAEIKFLPRAAGKENGAKLKNILATLKNLLIYIFTHQLRWFKRYEKKMTPSLASQL